jgi:glycosyltransferase involved in cell wall biosynthesis
MSSPLVTILVPTYKRAEFLKVALESALAQTHKPLEILVLDDASPDNTPEVVAQYSSDSRIRYVRHEQNKNISGNWRFGIENARGEFFAILHDDDSFEPEFIARLLEPHLKDEDTILSFCDHWVMDESG